IGCQPDIDAGVKVGVDLGAWVMNASFGTPATSLDASAPPPHEKAVRYATQRGCALIAAAGNSGKPEVFYPAAFEDVICVTSVDHENRLSKFSTSGPHVALCAPGERIVSVARHGYQINSGTSFAAPFVTGAAALVLSRAMRKGRRLSPREVRQ